MTTAVTTIDDVQHVAEQVAAGLDQLLHAEYWKLPGGDLLNAARSVEHLARLTYAVQVAVAGEIDLAHLAQTHGQPSTAALLLPALPAPALPVPAPAQAPPATAAPAAGR